jgi:hypothetical protein
MTKPEVDRQPSQRTVPWETELTGDPEIANIRSRWGLDTDGWMDSGLDIDDAMRDLQHLMDYILTPRPATPHTPHTPHTPPLSEQAPDDLAAKPCPDCGCPHYRHCPGCGCCLDCGNVACSEDTAAIGLSQ